jgi:XTP/dITP diphosphohydrolase
LTRTPLLVATTNPGKAREIRRALAGLPFRILKLQDVLPDLSYREAGRTFSDNARGKALFYSRRWDGLVLAEDSGLEVQALGGAPGVRSARFSRPHPSDEKNIRKLLRLLRGIPDSRRSARFVCIAVLAQRGRRIAEFKGVVRGRISSEPRGLNGFGYDPVFYYAPFGKTFAELEPAEKNRVSHRGRALEKVRCFLESPAALQAGATARRSRKGGRSEL